MRTRLGKSRLPKLIRKKKWAGFGFPKNPNGMMVSDYAVLPTKDDDHPTRSYDGLLLEHGFERLSSEGCGLSMRILYDLSTEAVKILEKFLSVDLGQAENSWGHKDGQGWKSFMMPRSIMRDLCVFILAYEYHYRYIAVAHVTNKDRLGFTADYIEAFDDKDIADQWSKAATLIYGQGNFHIIRAEGDSLNGTRNRHFWFGRVE
jgi:hypothetical protein